MNQAQQKFKDWIISHLNNPGALTASDHKMLDIIIVQVPAFLGMMLAFTVISAIYLWGLKKYGFEKTIIVLMVNLSIIIGQVSGAIKQLANDIRDL